METIPTSTEDWSGLVDFGHFDLWAHVRSAGTAVQFFFHQRKKRREFLPLKNIPNGLVGWVGVDVCISGIEMGVSKNGGTQNEWFTMENLIKIDDLEVPLFSETPK